MALSALYVPELRVQGRGGADVAGARAGGLINLCELGCRVTGSGGYGFHVIDGCRTTLKKCRTERCARGGYEFADAGPDATPVVVKVWSGDGSVPAVLVATSR